MANLGGVGGFRPGLAVWLVGAKLPTSHALLLVPRDRNPGNRSTGASEQGRSLPPISADHQRVCAVGEKVNLSG